SPARNQGPRRFGLYHFGSGASSRRNRSTPSSLTYGNARRRAVTARSMSAGVTGHPRMLGPRQLGEADALGVDTTDPTQGEALDARLLGQRPRPLHPRQRATLAGADAPLRAGDG